MSQYWTIVESPDRFDMICSYFIGHYVPMVLIEGMHDWDKGPESSESIPVDVLLAYLVPVYGERREVWTIWGHFKAEPQSDWTRFYGTYSFEKGMGTIHEVDRRQFEAFSLDA